MRLLNFDDAQYGALANRSATTELPDHIFLDWAFGAAVEEKSRVRTP